MFERAERELEAIPGVRGVAAGMVPLIAGDTWTSTLTVEGYKREPGKDTNANLNEVGPGFFGRMGVPVDRRA